MPASHKVNIEYLVDQFRRSRVHQKESQFVFLVGAGISSSAGIPTAREMVEELRSLIYVRDNNLETEEVGEVSPEVIDEWFEEHFPELNEEPDYGEHLKEYCPSRKDRKRFIEKVIKRAVYYNDAHRYLALILKQGSFARTVFTTNFDDLLHRALGDLGEGFQFFDEPSLVNRVSLDENSIQVAHIHGRFQNYSLQNTDDEIEDVSAKIRERFREFVEKKGVVVVGYSGWDDICMEVLREAAQDPGLIPNGLYWVSHGKLDDTLKNLFQTDGRYYLEDQDADTFFESLYKQLSGALEGGTFPNLIKDPVSFTKHKLIDIKRRAAQVEEKDFNARNLSGLTEQLERDISILATLEDKFLEEVEDYEREKRKQNLTSKLKGYLEEFQDVDEDERRDIMFTVRDLCNEYTQRSEQKEIARWVAEAGTSVDLSENQSTIWDLSNFIAEFIMDEDFPTDAAVETAEKILNSYPDIPLDYSFRLVAFTLTEDDDPDKAEEVLQYYIYMLREVDYNSHAKYAFRKEIIKFWEKWKKWWSDHDMFDKYSSKIGAYKGWNTRMEERDLFNLFLGH